MLTGCSTCMRDCVCVCVCVCVCQSCRGTTCTIAMNGPCRVSYESFVGGGGHSFSEISVDHTHDQVLDICKQKNHKTALQSLVVNIITMLMPAVD